MAEDYVGEGGVWSQNRGVSRYTYSGDDALWKTAKNKLDRDYMVSKKRKRVQKKYGYDPANRAKLQSNLDALESRGITKDSIAVRRYESKLASGRGDFVTRNMLKHLKAGTNTSRRSETNPMGRGGEAQIPNTAQVTPISARARVTTAAPIISTPKETVRRKALPRISSRLKQKISNLRAGIRT